MRVALVCPTVGQTRRGYERFMTDLFGLLQRHHDVVLLKGAGKSAPGERVVPHLRRTGILSRLCGTRLPYRRYQLEFATFGAALLPYLARGSFDVVHFIDPPLARVLVRARRLLRARFRLLFTNGGPAFFDASGSADHVHCLTPDALREAQDAGAPPDRLTMIPVGIDTRTFDVSRDRDALRREWDVPASAFVILSVASLNRAHKRIDHLIEDVARVPGDLVLWLGGSLHPDGDPSLLELARARLGARFRYTHVASARVPDLFAAADVMVSAAVNEPFGMAVVEAMCAGLPVVTHDSAHFRWLGGEVPHYVDMSVPGALAARLGELMNDRAALRRTINPSGVAARFSWASLEDSYLQMYERIRGAEPLLRK